MRGTDKKNDFSKQGSQEKRPITVAMMVYNEARALAASGEYRW